MHKTSSIPSNKTNLNTSEDIIDYFKKKKNYRKIEDNPGIYSIDDFVVVSSEEGKSYSICKIIDMIPLEGLAIIEIQWYYRKEKINWAKNKQDPSICKDLSNKELFESDHYDTISPESIKCKCQVLSLKDYQLLKLVRQTTFFTRTKYHYKSGLLFPPVEKWPRICSCNKPINPDKIQTQCLKCRFWFHPSCEGSADTKSKNNIKIYCGKCTKRY